MITDLLICKIPIFILSMVLILKAQYCLSYYSFFIRTSSFFTFPIILAITPMTVPIAGQCAILCPRTYLSFYIRASKTCIIQCLKNGLFITVFFAGIFFQHPLRLYGCSLLVKDCLFQSCCTNLPR